MKNAEAKRKAIGRSRLSDVSVGRRSSSVRSIGKYSSRSSSKQSTNSSHKSSREDRALEEKNQDCRIDSWNRVYGEKADFGTASTNI